MGGGVAQCYCTFYSPPPPKENVTLGQIVHRIKIENIEIKKGYLETKTTYEKFQRKIYYFSFSLNTDLQALLKTYRLLQTYRLYTDLQTYLQTYGQRDS